LNVESHNARLLFSAGVGRSGTLIALDKLLEEAADTQSIDVLKCIEGLRMQRMQMVQTVVSGRHLYDTNRGGGAVGSGGLTDLHCNVGVTAIPMTPSNP